MTYAYIRVSSKDQNEARQLEKMRELGISDENIYLDKQSGKDFNREKYNELISRLVEGDLLYVLSIDRLGRNYNDIQRQWEIITKEIKADIVVLDMPLLDTRDRRDLTGKFIADMVLQVLAYVAEKERENIRERQREGIELAKARGVYKGRAAIEIEPAAFESVYKRWKIGEMTAREAMAELGIKPNTFYRRVREYEESKQ